LDSVIQETPWQSMTAPALVYGGLDTTITLADRLLRCQGYWTAKRKPLQLANKWLSR
jgi:hypothetical protein